MDDAWTMEAIETTVAIPTATARDGDQGCRGYALDVSASTSPVKYGLDAAWIVSEDDDDDDARDVRRSRAIAGSTGREIIVISASSRDDETKRALSGRERRTRPRVGASGIGWGNRNPGEPAHRIDADVE